MANTQRVRVRLTRPQPHGGAPARPRLITSTESAPAPSCSGGDRSSGLAAAGEAAEEERAIPHLLRVVAVESSRLPGTGKAQVPHGHRHLPGHREIAIPGQAHRHAYAQRPGYSALCRRTDAAQAPGSRPAHHGTAALATRATRSGKCRFPVTKHSASRWDAPGVGTHG